VGAGRGCGKARYGTVVRPLHVFQGEAHSGFQRCEAMRREREVPPLQVQGPDLT
jgi:hypothetical protein